MKRVLRQEGITLVALVITIIVLLILAGVTLKLTLGENGLLRRAQESANAYEEGARNDAEFMNNAYEYMEQYFNESIGGTKPGEGGNEPTPPNPTEPVETPIEEIKSDWEMIEKIAEKIADDDSITSDTEKATVVVDNKKYVISVGDIFEVEYNEEIIQVRILGFKHDDLVNTGVYGGNHSKASISFECVSAINVECRVMRW